MLTLYIDGTGTINFSEWRADFAAEGHLLNGHLNAQYTNKQHPQYYLTKEEKADTKGRVQNMIKLQLKP